MTEAVQRLQSKLDQISRVLGEQSFFSFTAEERQSMLAQANDLSKKLVSIGSSFLTIGLVGGTGVGKSTLMNALAGSKITSTSHRRPHTDHVLIYRYADANPLTGVPLMDVAWREVTHESKAIRQILLCDLPDFDSLMGEHRERLIRFMEHLDLLVWVTSPEKYANGRFYEFLQVVPKARQNFYFLLNKADLFFEDGNLEEGYSQMTRVVRSFHGHIKGKGIDEPLLYALSAEEALNAGEPAPWNQFPAFRREIFQQWNIKKVTAIKAANLDVEVDQLLSAFQKEVRNLESFERILEASVKEFEEHRSVWVQAGHNAVDTWLMEHIGQDILSYSGDPNALVGPGYVIALLLGEWQRLFAKKKAAPSQLSTFIAPQEITVSFRRRLEWLQDRLNHRVLRENLPSAFRDRLEEILDVTSTLQELREGFSNSVSLSMVQPLLPSFWGFRVFQLLTYFSLLAFFLFAIGGETAWRGVLNHPGGPSILNLVLSCVHNIFSVKGLAALGSFAMLNLLFALRFYRRYSKLLRHAGIKIIESLKTELGKAWEETLDSVLTNINQFGADIRFQISTVSSLERERR